jgi:hypothetical protein
LVIESKHAIMENEVLELWKMISWSK